MDKELELYEILLSNNVKLNYYNAIENKQFRDWLYAIIPELEATSNCPQNTPWHIYNVLDHILVSVENINKITRHLGIKDRKMLAYVMLLHDLGKPKCRIIRQVGDKFLDSFPNHAIESEKIARRALIKLDFSPQEIELMALLVRNHDMFIPIVKNPTKEHQKKFSKELILSIIDEYNAYGNGKDILSKLVLISTADDLAQNPELNVEPLEILEETKTILNNLS